MSNPNDPGCCGPNKPCNCKEVENPGHADNITQELKTEGNALDGTPAPKFTLTDRQGRNPGEKPPRPRTVFEKAVYDVTTEGFDCKAFVFKFRERCAAIIRSDGYRTLKKQASVRREAKLDRLDTETNKRAVQLLYRNPLEWGIQANRSGKLFGLHKSLCVNTLTLFGYDIPFKRKLGQNEFDRVVEIITSNYRDALEENLKNEELATKAAAVLHVENTMLGNKAQRAKIYEELYQGLAETFEDYQLQVRKLLDDKNAEIAAVNEKVAFANSLNNEFAAKIVHLESKQNPAKKVKGKVKAKAKKTLKKKTR